MDVDPISPSLSDLISGSLTLSAYGDQTRKATCRLELTDAADAVFSSTTLISHQLPITTDAWTGTVGRTVKYSGDKIDFFSAHSASLIIEAEDFGDFRIPLSVDIQPMRWVQRRDKDILRLRLINEGEDGDTDVEHWTFTDPTTSKSVPLEHAIAGVDLARAFGLFVAKTDEPLAVVACGVEAGHDFSYFRLDFDFTKLRAFQHPGDYVRAYRAWLAGTPNNPLASHRRRLVLTALHNEMLRAACGLQWVHSEEKCTSSSRPDRWNAIESAVKHPSYAISLSAAADCSDGHIDLEQVHGQLSAAYKLTSDPAVAAAAWLVANRPELCDPSLQVPADQLQRGSFAVLVRGARLLALKADDLLRTAL